MAVKYTEEQLHTIDKSTLIHMLLQSQEQVSTLTDEVHALNEKMQLIMEQLVLANRNRFGRSSEKMADAEQICFQEVDGNSFLMQSQGGISLFLQKLKSKSITSAYMPAKPMDTWSRQNIQRVCSTAVRYLRLSVQPS